MDLEFPGGKTLRLVIGDITKLRVGVIVNAANSQLRGGGGVDGAIHRVGGHVIARELDQIRQTSGPCPPGHAVVTSAGGLPATRVFHAVGPVYRDGEHGEPEQLASCYRTCLELAEKYGHRTISFPAISTGAYGFPADEAARIALAVVREHLLNPASGIREVILVLWDQGAYDVYTKALAQPGRAHG
jgi:O-acetyl-ADP-ribose deacetylase (regulator of RNase III)